MTAVPTTADAERIEPGPFNKLRAQARAVLTHALSTHRDGLRVFESLRNLNEVVGTEYGDRVLYELIQNAHDAHPADDRGRIAVRLSVNTETDGTLYVANGGNGFRWKDVDAIQNLATTAKEVGEGIGNKGLGFRSIEALTDDVRIYSRRGRTRSTEFDGYCFRFAAVSEIENLLHAEGIDAATARDVAGTVPRYLVPVPLDEQPPDVARYAELGYASVIVAPLRTPEAIALAQRQVQALADLDEVPLLLFLDRIAEFRLDVQTPNGENYARRLTRRQTLIGHIPGIESCRMDEVRVGQNRRFLVVRRDVDKSRVLEAVRHSVSKAPQIKRWLDWKGQPSVAVAVGLSADTIVGGRLYNFLPMGDKAAAPLLGHLDAPFFAHIDRRNADFDLPLNATLMAAAAEACASTALHLAEQADPPVPKRAVFDLIAWTGEHARRLDQALADADSSLQHAPVVPSIPVNDAGWTSLLEVFAWPDGAFSLMKATAVARRTGARLVSSDLDSRRLARLKAMADREYLPLSPSGDCLADWAERFAASLAERNAAAITWRRFYDDLNRLFDAAGEMLGSLAGRNIILDRGRRLRPAGGHDASGIGAFVRSESSRRRRTKDGVPLPPSSLTRRYKFLHESIKLPHQTLNAFVQAGLVREYDPVDALAGLSAVLGDRANENRRLEALTWAFSVWRTAGPGIRDALLGAGLRVPTAGGWRPATRTAFPASWTAIGRILENFLVEASSVSPDCRRSRDALLVEFVAWPEVRGGTRRQWVEFLISLGVTDGLRPVAGQLKHTGQGWTWDQLRRNGEARAALDRAWCAAASHVSFGHPYTTYSRKGEAWRLPGQIEYDELSDAAKQAFHQLAFKHLADRGAECLTFDVGRFDRGPRYHDRQTLPSPLAAFLRSRAWIAVDTRDEPRFHRVGDCWAARTRQGRPPRFIARLPDADATLVERTDEFADLVFGEVLGVSDWEAASTAVRRLRALAAVAADLAPHDRRDFHREYRRAWKDLTDLDAALPTDLDLAVNRAGRLDQLAGDETAPPTVIVAPNAQAFDARILASAGHALLDIGDAPATTVTERLAATDMFAPRRLDGIGVQLLVDGDAFVPTTSDPLLTSLGLGWLPEVAVLGHELLAEGIERGVRRTTVERRIRAIRVRRCRSIALIVDGQVVTPSEDMAFYGFEHDELPTLILVDRLQLTRSSLGWHLSRTVSRLVDTRLRYLEPLLLRLAQSQTAESLEAPADEVLAAALGCDARILDEYRAALRTDLGHVLHLLAPVVAYLANIVLARELLADADQAGAAFDVRQWLDSRLPVTDPAPNDLLAACERAADRAVIRRELGLDYARFNLVLRALDEPFLSNEDELRSVYRGYLERMRPEILERLRRRHAADYRSGRDLGHYVARKSLDFLPFEDDWILTRETLDQGVVDAHVSRLLDDALGTDEPADLPPWRGLLERNRRTVRDFAADAASILAAWCRRNGVQSLEPWQSDDPQALARHLENAGLLDFEIITTVELPQLCRRSGCWPSRMPSTLDRATLKLDQAAIQKEELRRERERQRRIIEERSIEFSGTVLDTGAPGFAGAFRQLAEKGIAADPDWYERSRQRPRLAEVTQPSGGGTGGGNSGGTGRRRRPNEAQRLAMGLASEWLAFQFLQRRHGDSVTEDCWVSSNRARFFGGGGGDDAAGYDFRFSTPRAEWLYEVKSAIEDTGEFELTPNEMRVAASVSKDGRHRYRILYVPFVFSPDRWFVLELPNPMGDATRNRFRQVGQGSVRFKFERSTHPARC